MRKCACVSVCVCVFVCVYLRNIKVREAVFKSFQFVWCRRASQLQQNLLGYEEPEKSPSLLDMQSFVKSEQPLREPDSVHLQVGREQQSVDDNMTKLLFLTKMAPVSKMKDRS